MDAGEIVAIAISLLSVLINYGLYRVTKKGQLFEEKRYIENKQRNKIELEIIRNDLSEIEDPILFMLRFKISNSRETDIIIDKVYFGLEFEQLPWEINTLFGTLRFFFDNRRNIYRLGFEARNDKVDLATVLISESRTSSNLDKSYARLRDKETKQNALSKNGWTKISSKSGILVWEGIGVIPLSLYEKLKSTKYQLCRSIVTVTLDNGEEISSRYGLVGIFPFNDDQDVKEIKRLYSAENY